MLRSPARRRRLRSVAAKVLVGAVTALAAGVLLFFSMGSERIRDYGVDVVVLEDGSALVRETIDYDFAANSRHGLVRAFPADSRVGRITVRSATAPDDAEVSRTDGVEIRVGDPGTTVTGRHRYVIEYHLGGVVTSGRVALDVIGTEWTVPIDHVRVVVATPFAVGKVTCYQGQKSARLHLRYHNR